MSSESLERRARNVAALALAGVACALAGCDGAEEPARRPNVLLVTIDSLRYDHLGCYGYPKPTSPTIDRLAAEGARFETALSTTSWTLPSHAALFTGLFDSAHGLVTNGLALAPAHATLAEGMRSKGYQTAGFFGGPYLHPTYGLNQGFEHYQSCMTQLPDALGEDGVRDASRGMIQASHRDVTGPRTIAEVERWVESSDDRPFFAFVHLWDVHFDYIPPESYWRMFDPDYQGTLSVDAFMANPAIHPQMSPRDLEHLIARYDGEIRFTDDVLARLLELFERKAGSREDLLVVVTADHGEEFFEHGRKGHQQSLYEEVVRVPMIVRWPGEIPAGRVIDEPVSLIDVMPTLLAATGPGVPVERSPARDLLPLLRADAEVDAAPALLELHVPPYELRALRTETFKLISKDHGAAVIGCDLAADPRERSVVPPDDPRLARSFDELQRLVESSNELRKRIGGDPTRAVVDPKLEELLRQLGY